MSTAAEVRAGLVAKQQAAIPAEWRVSPADVAAAGAHPMKAIESRLTARERELTESKGVDLVEVGSHGRAFVFCFHADVRSSLSPVQAMVSGKLTSEELTRAVCKRAALAHQFTNCLTESGLFGAAEFH